jgi:hypothetical protein
MEVNDTLILLSLTQAEINAITSPSIGGMLYNSTTNTIQIYNGSDWKESTITDTDSIPEGVVNLYYTEARVSGNSAVLLNTAKVTNANHTGEVTGSGALTVGSTAISNKTLITAASGMEVLVNDGGTLKKVNASDFLGGSGSSYIACCPFGAKSDSLGKFLIANGKSSDADDSTKPKTRQPIGLDGTLTKLVYKTKDGSTSTRMKVHVNGVVEETVVLSSMNANDGGVETISVSVSAGDYVEIEYDGSQKPGECTMYFIQEL